MVTAAQESAEAVAGWATEQEEWDEAPAGSPAEMDAYWAAMATLAAAEEHQ